MRFLLFCMIPLVIVLPQARSQDVQAAVIAGLNLSQVDGDEVYGFYKPGLNMGLSAIVPVGRHFNFALETLFNQKGAFQGDQYFSTDSAGNVLTGAYNLRLNYLEVPILFFFNDKDIIMGGAGISYGRLVGIKEEEHRQRITTTTLNSGTYNRDDFNIMADIRFRVYKKFQFNVRYAYSLLKIRTREFESFIGDTWERNQYNNLLSFRLIYMINEKPPLADPKK
ncbi:MAG: outer membrane beta-barrel protein [Bacteroidales bacterium]